MPLKAFFPKKFFDPDLLLPGGHSTGKGLKKIKAEGMKNAVRTILSEGTPLYSTDSKSRTSRRITANPNGIKKDFLMRKMC